MTHSARSGLRLLSTSIYLSLVGLFSTASSLWVLTRELGGSALPWVSWLSVLGAFVALPASMLAARRLAETPVRLTRRA